MCVGGELCDSVEQVALGVASADGWKVGHVCAEDRSGVAVVFVGECTKASAELGENLRTLANVRGLTVKPSVEIGNVPGAGKRQQVMEHDEVVRFGLETLERILPGNLPRERHRSRGVESQTPKHCRCVGGSFSAFDCRKDELVETRVGRGPLSQSELEHTHVPVHVHVVRIGTLPSLEPVTQEPMTELIATFVGKPMSEDVHLPNLSIRKHLKLVGTHVDLRDTVPLQRACHS